MSKKNIMEVQQWFPKGHNCGWGQGQLLLRSFAGSGMNVRASYRQEEESLFLREKQTSVVYKLWSCINSVSIIWELLKTKILNFGIKSRPTESQALEMSSSNLLRSLPVTPTLANI